MSSNGGNSVQRLLREIHRRSLWQVLGIYLVGGWIAFEVVQTLTEGLGLPEWFPALAIVLLVLGLPIVLATGFIQEGGPASSAADSPSDFEGILSSDGEPDGEAGATRRLFTWKNAILGGVGALALWGILATGWILFGGEGIGESAGSDAGAPASIERSVAVLPFANMSANPDNEYFSDGVTEELLNALAQIPDLRVPGRTSSFAFKGRNLTIQQIADTLDVAHVLEGSVRRAGDQVLITAQLVDAQSDSHLWSDTYERELDDIFAIQRQIAQAIADQLEVTLSGDASTLVVADATESPEAHEHYLRGRYFMAQRSGESLRSAIREFQRAIALDSTYAEAFSGLAESYFLVDSYSPAEESDIGDNLERGLVAARRAVSLAPDLGMARASLAYGHWSVGEWEAAEREFQRAIELSPSSSEIRHWYALHLWTTGRASEGVLESQRALELDPVSRINSADLGRALWVAGRIEESLEQGAETVALAPDWPTGWLDLWSGLIYSGDYEGARAAWDEYLRLLGVDRDVGGEAFDAVVRYMRDGQVQSIDALADMSPPVSFFYYLYSGQADRAIDVFEEAFVRPGAFGDAADLHVLNPYPDLLNERPRYQALLDEAGITW